MNIIKPASKLVVGDKLADGFVVKLDDTTTPGVVAVWTFGKGNSDTPIGPKADLIFNHGDPVIVSI